MKLESLEVIRIVQEDLNDLFEDFGGDDYIDSRIRKASSTLNMLLIENNLSRAYKLAFGMLAEIRVKSPSLEVFMNHDPNNTIVNGLAGGAHLKGIQYALYIKNEGSKSIDIPPNSNPIEIELKINSWLDRIGIIIDKTPIKRRFLLSYIANKKGGKHIDGKRGNSKKDIIYKLLDEKFDFFIIYDKKNAVYLELHSMIQSLMHSIDIQKFLKV